MATLMQAIQLCRPGVNCADLDGSLAGVRWDAPLPDGFVPPTQAEIGAAIAQLDQPLTVTQKLAAAGLTVAELKQALGLS